MVDDRTGERTKSESFVGKEKMIEKDNQKYLGDVISANGSHARNIQQRCNRGLGIITEIMSILDSTYFGKYYFETAIILRESLFLSSLLLNSEAWVGYSDKDIRELEKCDEFLLSKILGCDKNTSNTYKYLELGVVPLRFVIMKRKLGFLQYLLKQNKDSMIYKVLEATIADSKKNDFVYTCLKYLNVLKIEMNIEEIENVSKYKFKKLLNEKIQKAAFLYLNEQKQIQKNIKDIYYEDFKMQDYFSGRSVEVSRTIFRARGKCLQIKMQQKWRFKDTLCVGCKVREETGEEILECEKFGKNELGLDYKMFFENQEKQILVGKEMEKRMRQRKKMLEDDL